MKQDPTGGKWLLPLLRLGSRSSGRLEGVTTAALPLTHPRWWGCNERPLGPPKPLLRWLVAHLRAPASGAWGCPATREKRESLVAGNRETIKEALSLLADHPAFHRAWYVLEGQSKPDVCLKTDSLLVVIEGKRTERTETVKTTWMESRSQMLRHMDAAWEIRECKRVLGLMIVEGEGCGASVLQVPPRWEGAVCKTVCIDLVGKSLPHRNEVERKEIIAGFLGATTWQKVCTEFGLGWPPCQSPK